MEINNIQRIRLLGDTVREYADVILQLNDQVVSFRNELPKIPPALKEKARYIEADTGKTYEFNGSIWIEVKVS